MATLCNSCESQDTCKIFEIMGDGMPITHCKNYIQTRRETVRVKQTNADRIRAMSDEELAEVISGLGDCDTCYLYHRRCSMNISCKDAVLEWLRKEAEDG